MRLLTDPPRLDCGGEHFEPGIGRQVRHIVFLLPGRSPLANEPDLVARHALHAIVEHPVLMAIRNADAASCKVACQPTSGAASPADLLPFLIGQHRIGRDRRPVRDVIPPRVRADPFAARRSQALRASPQWVRAKARWYDTGGACQSSRRGRSGQHRPERRSGVAKARLPTAGRAPSKPGGKGRLTPIPRRPARSRNALRRR